MPEACHIAFVCSGTMLPSASTHYYRLRQHIAIVRVNALLLSASALCYCQLQGQNESVQKEIKQGI